MLSFELDLKDPHLGAPEAPSFATIALEINRLIRKADPVGKMGIPVEKFRP